VLSVELRPVYRLRTLSSGGEHMAQTKHTNGHESVDELFRDDSEEPMRKTPLEAVKDNTHEVNDVELLDTNDDELLHTNDE
jgi:hypothetical protein